MSLLGSLSRGAGMARLADARAGGSRPACLGLGRPRFIRDTGGKPKRKFDHPATNPVIDPVGGADRGAEVTLKSSA
jgi:hypothetical protein